MKIYSLLVHPELNSLNSYLFESTNNYFTSQGHTVKTRHIMSIIRDLYDSADQLYNSHSNSQAVLGSDYRHNWANARNRNLISPTVENEINNLFEADILYIQTPIWVYTIPAMLKTYIEQVFLINEFFTLHNTNSPDFKIKHLTKNKKAIFSCTVGGCKEMISHVTGGNSENLTDPIKNIFNFVGFDCNSVVLYNTTGPVNNSREIAAELISQISALNIIK